MHAKSRYWASVALGGVLTFFAVLLGRPAPLIGAAGIGVLLLAHQYRFVKQTRRTVEDLSVVQTCSRGRVTKDEPFAVTLDAALATPSSLDIELVCDQPVTVTGVDEGERRVELPAGERETTTTAFPSGSVAGRVTFEPPVARLTDPFALFTESVRVGDSVSVHVEAQTARQLHIGAGGEQIAIGYGERDTIQLGAGQEPVEIREYTPGDELRHIDWKASARLNKPHVRKYERKTPRRTTLVVDHRASMSHGPPGERKLDYARDVALLFLRDARVHEDPISLITVGDEGVTAAHGFGTGLEQYNQLREWLYDLTPTSNPAGESVDESFSTHTARARRLADRFAAGTSSYDRTLRPYVAERDAYVRRLDSRPLFSAVRANATELRRSAWRIVVTDDSNRGELLDAVKLARQGDGHVAVFLTPTALFDADDDAERSTAYRRYRDFENFRQTLSNMGSVSAFEVGPGDRLEAILSVGRDARAGRTDDERHRAEGVQ